MHADAPKADDRPCCRAQDSLAVVAQKLLEHGCGGLPVLDAQGRQVEIVTDRDICKVARASGRRLHELRVIDAIAMSFSIEPRPRSLRAMAKETLERSARRDPAPMVRDRLQ